MELFALIFISIILFFSMNNLFRKFGIEFLNPLSWIFSFLTRPPLKDDGMMSKQDEIKTFSRFNTGLLVDGKNKRLSAKDSYSHLALFSRTGGGKTTSFVLPNIFKLATQECSMVITDLSGEIYEKTSNYLNSQGFKIYVLDPDNLETSIRYNPLHYANNSKNIDKACEVLIASSGMKGTKSDDLMWSNGAKTLISIIIKALNETEDKRYINLANVRHILNNFLKLDKNEQPIINEFFKKYADDKTLNEYIGLVSNNKKTLQGFISTANVALNPIGINDNLEKLTYTNSIDFKKLRKEKSIVYIKIKEQEQEQYSFLLNLFYSQLFNEMMSELPKEKDLDLFCLLDEFGNMQIPKFPSIVTTIRKYRVSLSIILQNVNQLSNKYSFSDAKTILDGGIANKLIYSGVDSDLGSQLEKMFGYKETLKKQADGREYYDKEPVMNLAQMRTMKDNEALYVYANKKPLRLTTKPYYKDMMYNSFSKLPAYKNKIVKHNDNVEYFDLENIEWNV
jgi:type IV secretory pathway TraG/TraD family ATPase VirD4